MTTPDTTPPLLAHLCRGPVQETVRTGLFGRQYFLSGSFLIICAYLYENGALLGRAKRGSPILLETILGPPPQRGQLIDKIQEMANHRLATFVSTPNSFFRFIFETELKLLGLSLSQPTSELFKALKGKCRLNKQATDIIQLLTIEGIGFGIAFPDITEHMYRNAHENINMDTWAEARQAGIAVPASPTLITLEERENLVIQQVVEYLRECQPDLLESFKLN